MGTKALKIAQHTLTEKTRCKDKLLGAPVDLGAIEGIFIDQIQQMKTDIMDAFNTVIDDFKRVERYTNQRLLDLETFMKETMQMNKFLKPFLSAEQTFASIRKLPLVGAK